MLIKLYLMKDISFIHMLMFTCAVFKFHNNCCYVKSCGKSDARTIIGIHGDMWPEHIFTNSDYLFGCLSTV